jgi:hypothetical protein
MPIQTLALTIIPTEGSVGHDLDPESLGGTTPKVA